LKIQLQDKLVSASAFFYTWFRCFARHGVLSKETEQRDQRRLLIWGFDSSSPATAISDQAKRVDTGQDGGHSNYPAPSSWPILQNEFGTS